MDRARDSAARQVRTAASIARLRLPGGATVAPSGAYVLTKDGPLGDAAIGGGLPALLLTRVESTPGRVFTEPVLDGSEPAVYAGTQLRAIGSIYARQSLAADLEELAELLISSRQWRGRLVARELIVH